MIGFLLKLTLRTLFSFVAFCFMRIVIRFLWDNVCCIWLLKSIWQWDDVGGGYTVWEASSRKVTVTSIWFSKHLEVFHFSFWTLILLKMPTILKPDFVIPFSFSIFIWWCILSVGYVENFSFVYFQIFYLYYIRDFR